MNQFTLFLTGTQGRIARGPPQLDEDSEAKVSEFPSHEFTSSYIPCLQSSSMIFSWIGCAWLAWLALALGA